jgi:hypothetical protein
VSDELYAAYEAARAAYNPHAEAAMTRRIPGIEGAAGFTAEDNAEFARIVAEIDRSYEAYLAALPLRWYVVADREDADKEYSVWTISRDPRQEGWCTDSGCPGYGLTFAAATELADAANAAWAKAVP